MRVPEVVSRTADDIRSMRIRGAGRIARVSLEAIRDSMDELCRNSDSTEALLSGLREAERTLLNTRPTAVALPNALAFFDNCITAEASRGATKEELAIAARNAVSEFIRRMGESQQRIVDLALPLIPRDSTAITHCHSSVAVAVMRGAAKRKLLRTVYVTETRPRHQGRIVSRQLRGSGADVKFITDSAAGFFIKEVDVMIVGADAIAMNGDLANKVGTFPMAVLAKQQGKKVLVCAESYKIATGAMSGDDIPIEFRDPREIYDDPGAIGDPEILNPAFDITPNRFIDVIVTEMGIVRDLGTGIPQIATKAGLISKG